MRTIFDIYVFIQIVIVSVKIIDYQRLKNPIHIFNKMYVPKVLNYLNNLLVDIYMTFNRH